MRWQGRRESDNVEDIRGRRSMGRTGAGLGCGGVILVLVIAFATGQDPLALLQMVEGTRASLPSSPAPADPRGSAAVHDELGKFASVVLADTEETWSAIFQREGATYQKPKLVLFSDAVESACGYSSSAVGPFYCPGDRKVYLDLSFFSELSDRFGAPGDFAQAYVIAHEVGHHIQNLIGVLPAFNQKRQQVSEREANRLSVRVELQADCLAGVWAHHAQKERDFIEPGDIEEALNAASRIGDDSIQRTIQGYAVPDSFTHGSSEQRVRWFKTGFESGRMASCDTFRGAI